MSQILSLSDIDPNGIYTLSQVADLLDWPYSKAWKFTTVPLGSEDEPLIKAQKIPGSRRLLVKGRDIFIMFDINPLDIQRVNIVYPLHPETISELDPNRLYRTQTICKLANVSEAMIRKQIKNGYLKAVKLPGSKIIQCFGHQVVSWLNNSIFNG